MWTQFVLRLSDGHIWDTWTINTDEQLTHPCVCNYMSGYKNMRKVVQHIPLKTMAALVVLEDIANGTIGRERVFRDREDLLAHDENWLISREGNPPGTVRRVAGVGAQQRGAIRCLCPQVNSILGFLATGAFQRDLANRLPVDPELSHGSRAGQNYPHLSQVYPIPIQYSWTGQH